MRVLVVSKLFPRPERTVSGVFVAEQAKSLLGLGAEIEVVSPRPRRLGSGIALRSHSQGSRAVVDGLAVTYLDYLHLPLRLSTRFEVWSLTRRLLPLLGGEHKREPIDVLHAHQLFPTGLATATVGRRLGIPVVCTAHGSDVHTHPQRNRGIARDTRAALREVDRVVAVSEDLARRIRVLEPLSAEVEVIYNGTDPGTFGPGADQLGLRRQLGLPAQGTGFCTIGRLVREKGIAELVAAFRKVLRTHEDAWLVVVGDGPLRSQLEAWSNELAGRVVVAGPVAHSEVARYLNAADVFVLPSHQEGVPVAILEAMACGLPIIATAVGGIPEVVTPGLHGLLIAPRDELALVESVRHLLADADLRQRLGAEARKRIRDGFHWVHGSAKLMSLYEGIVLSSRPSRVSGRDIMAGSGLDH